MHSHPPAFKASICSPQNRSDHPSCLTQKAALALPCARPFFPTFQVYNTVTDERTLSWPALSGWPTSPAELERKNAAHLATPGANPHFVDTRENVYADVAEDAEEFVAGEDPVGQLEFFIQVVEPDAVGHLMRLVQDGGWEHGWGDDVLFGVALHRSDGEVAELLGCEVETVKRWFEQAEVSVFREHVRVSRGPIDGLQERVLVEEQEERWRKAVGEFRARHEIGSGGEWKRLRCCDGMRIEEAFVEANRKGVRRASQGSTVDEFCSL